MTPVRAVGSVLSRRKGYVLSQSEGMSVQVRCGIRSRAVGVNAYIAQILTEARLEEGARAKFQRTACAELTRHAIGRCRRL
jgi:hypothetical protein